MSKFAYYYNFRSETMNENKKKIDKTLIFTRLDINFENEECEMLLVRDCAEKWYESLFDRI